MARRITSFPVQKLSLNRKGKKWGEDCVDYIIGSAEDYFGGYASETAEMQKWEDLYNSIYDERDLKYVTNPYKQADGFPASARNYNIIRSKINVLLGEESKRPNNIRVLRTSDIAAGEAMDKAKQMIMDYMMAAIMARMSPENQARFQEALQNGEIQTPEQIQKYFTKDYKDIKELTVYHLLKFLELKLGLQNEFLKGWHDKLIKGAYFYYVGIENGMPTAQWVDPRFFWYEDAEGIEYAHEADKCCNKMFMSPAQIYDKFYDKLTERDLNAILDLVDQRDHHYSQGIEKDRVDDFNSIKLKFYSKLDKNNNPWTDDDTLTVFHCCWKSFKKIGFVSIIDPETGTPLEVEVDESYIPTGNELNVEWDWIVENWEGYRIDDDFYFGIQPIEYQHISEDNPNAQKLPYTGTRSTSLVKIMKPIQYMYIIVWYRLELAMARDKGRIAVMDVTQIPKGLGIDIPKWMHYLSALGVAFVNPYEEGWDIPGREGGKAAAFNQMQSWDLTMANTINQYIELLAKLEQMCDELSGVSRQRQGAISSNELVGNVERSVIQSSHITEMLFWEHNQVKKHVYTMLLDTAKSVFKENDKTYLNYILDDATRALLKIQPESLNEDYDIFISDSTKEVQIIEQLKTLVQPAMQNGASLLDILDIYVTDNVSVIRNKLEETEQRRLEQQQAMQEQEAQRQQQLVAMQNEIKEQELADKEADRQLEKYKIDTDNLTKVTVAEINAYRGSENMDQNANGVPDPMEIGKQAIEMQKLNSDAMNKQIELANKQRDTEYKHLTERRKIEQQERAEKLKATIEREKIDLEKQKMKEQEKLQKIKDQAAMEREQLKAKTAIKNKVPGEKK